MFTSLLSVDIGTSMKLDTLKCYICNKLYDLTTDYTNLHICPKCKENIDEVTEVTRLASNEPNDYNSQ